MIGYSQKIFLLSVMILIFPLLMIVSYAQIFPVKGKEQPPVYEEKAQILEREQRTRRSQVIQETARIYREMVSSYKARHIVHAEELSGRLENLLADPSLPESFVERMTKKHMAFLTRVYGESPALRIDVPDDYISDEEMKQIQEAVLKEGKAVPTGAAVELKKMDQDKRQQRNEIREQKKVLREQRRQDRLAEKDEARAARLQKLEEKKARRLKKSENPRTVSKQKVDQNHQQLKLKEIDHQLKTVTGTKEIKTSVVTKVIDMEQNALNLKRDEIDRYLRLYQEEMAVSRSGLREEFLIKIEALYQDGLEFLKRKAYQFAHDVLTEVEKLSPDYKKTRSYLSELEQYFRISQLQRVDFPDDSRLEQIEEALNAYQR